MTDVILVCEDVFGLEILDLLYRINAYLTSKDESARYRVLGYVSEEPSPFGRIPCRERRLGDLSSHPIMSPGARYILGVREPAAKRAAVSAILSRGGDFETVYSPWMLGPKLEVGRGSVIDAYSATADIAFGDYVTVCDAMLAGDYTVGDYSTILRFSNVIGAGVGEGVLIGSHVFVPHGKRVGNGARVLDGSIVVRDVKDGMTVSGIPARKSHSQGTLH